MVVTFLMLISCIIPAHRRKREAIPIEKTVSSDKDNRWML
jgi:hypothetical protein